MAASVKQRLLNQARKSGEDFGFLLGRFAVERFLYRLSLSEHAGEFVLKGAMLFHLRLGGMPHRPTRDLDLMGRGAPGGARMQKLIQGICRERVPEDGLVFRA